VRKLFSPFSLILSVSLSQYRELIKPLIDRGAHVTEFYDGASLFYGFFTAIPWAEFSIGGEYFDYFFSTPWETALTKFTPRQLTTSNGIPVLSHIIGHTAGLAVPPLVAWLTKNGPLLNIDITDIDQKTGCNAFHSCLVPTDVNTCLTAGLDYLALDWSGRNALDCLAFHRRTTPLVRLLSSLSDAEFARLITPQMIAIVVDHQQPWKSTRTLVSRVIAVCNQDTWKPLISTALQLMLRLQSTGLSVLYSFFISPDSQLTRRSNTAAEQIATIAEASVFEEFDMSPYSQAFSYLSSTFCLPLLEFLVYDGNYTTIENLYDLARRLNKTDEYFEQPNSPGKRALEYAMKLRDSNGINIGINMTIAALKGAF